MGLRAFPSPPAPSVWRTQLLIPGEKGQDEVSPRRTQPSFCPWNKSGSRRECGLSELTVGHTLVGTCLESLRMPAGWVPRTLYLRGAVTPWDTSSAWDLHSHARSLAPGISLRSNY